MTTADLARFMVGHDVRTENLHQDKELGGEILRGEGLSDGSHFRSTTQALPIPSCSASRRTA